MPTIQCPSCRQPLQVADASKSYNCPKCKAAISPTPVPPTATTLPDAAPRKLKPMPVFSPGWVIFLVIVFFANVIALAGQRGSDTVLQQQARSLDQIAWTLFLFVVAYGFAHVLKRQ